MRGYLEAVSDLWDMFCFFFAIYVVQWKRSGREICEFRESANQGVAVHFHGNSFVAMVD